MELEEIKVRQKFQISTLGSMKNVYDFEHKPNYIIKTWTKISDDLVHEEYEVFKKYPPTYSMWGDMHYYSKDIAHENDFKNRKKFHSR